MRIVLAYIIVIPLVQFAFSIGCLPVTLFGLALCWLPERVRFILVGLLAGVACSLAAIGFGYVVFHYVAGPYSFGGFALASAVVPLYFPMRRDLATYREDRESEQDSSELVRQAIGPATPYSLCLVIGEIAGIIVGTYWTQFRS